MISKMSNMLPGEPVVLHEKLHTTFSGVVHPISTQEATVHQYLGIKYASVPARFRQSKLHTVYPPVTDAARYGPVCPQHNVKGYEEELFGLPEDVIPQQTLNQNEFECLNLNITCPANALLPGSRLPVMFYIHGGGNRGSGSSWLYDGGALVQRSMMVGKPIILVTFNYRLGLFGFAASSALREDNHAAGEEGVGNYGLRDQRKALEWVYSFISDFGGDSTNITLFGSASGASDILCHMHSTANETRPLFQRAIVQSAVLDIDIPHVAGAAWEFSKLVSAIRAHTVEDLRAVCPRVLASVVPVFRAVDDGVFFAPGWKEAIYPDNDNELAGHEQVPEIQILSHRMKTPHGRLRSTSRPPRSKSRSRSRARHGPITNHYHHPPHLQPLMIGDCAGESLLWSLPASLWTAPGIVRRIRAICQSLPKASALLRAYDISSHTPLDELPEHIMDLINDARFAWPTECIASNAKRTRGGHNVWRYVFDQESPSRGLPHHAVDLLYLFDNVPLTVPPAFTPPDIYSPELTPEGSPLLTRPDTPDMYYGSDTDSDGVDFGFGFNNPEDDDAWAVPVVDEWTYARVRDAVQGRWFAFAYGEAPWHEDKVYVFGPEGEAGERSMSIFPGRRRVDLWKDALEPLGMHLAQKVGIELSNGPPAL